MAHENARILVVEDEDNLAMLIEYNLNKIGYVSEIADDGEKALDILKEKNFDLVVLDWMIPKISGIEVYSPICVLIFTSLLESLSRRFANQSGSLSAPANEPTTTLCPSKSHQIGSAHLCSFPERRPIVVRIIWCIPTCCHTLSSLLASNAST